MATDRLLRQAEVQDRTGLGRTTIWRLEKDGRFPARRRLVGSTCAWVESEITEWIHSRPLATGTEAE